MKLLFSAVIVVCCLALPFYQKSCRAALAAGPADESYSGVLQSINLLSDRYRLTIDGKDMYIMIEDKGKAMNLAGTAKSLLNQKVTITYLKASAVILSIAPFKEKSFH
ncbi:MAG: hypothetical protein JXR89_12995 [Deltaproteobacteria bacterium]|nr:hypothetical protein [Deltaproteobacteria bacterium]